MLLAPLGINFSDEDGNYRHPIQYHLILSYIKYISNHSYSKEVLLQTYYHILIMTKCYPLFLYKSFAHCWGSWFLLIFLTYGFIGSVQTLVRVLCLLWLPAVPKSGQPIFWDFGVLGSFPSIFFVTIRCFRLLVPLRATWPKCEYTTWRLKEERGIF